MLIHVFQIMSCIMVRHVQNQCTLSGSTITVSMTDTWTDVKVKSMNFIHIYYYNSNLDNLSYTLVHLKVLSTKQ